MEESEKTPLDHKDYVNKDSTASIEALSSELNRLSNLVEIQLKRQVDWKLPLRNGMLAGLGSILGATLLVSALLYLLRPLEKIEALSPTLQKITEDLSKTKK